MIAKKFRSLSVFVASLATVLSLVLGTTAYALTASDITMLQSAGIISASQAAALMTSIGGSSTMMTSSGYTFTSDLTIGSKGAAVTALQNMLVAQGDLVMPAGVAMGYFGTLTQSALAKFQAANGISPAAGYFGPKTRAFVNGMGGGVSVTPVNGGTMASAGSISVALAPTSPVNSTVVSPSATALLAQYTFTGSGQVNNVVLQRTGVSSDNTLNNVYLYNGATRLTDAASVANGVISFNNPNGLFTVNGSMTISVRADIASGAQGATVGVSLISLTTAGAAAAVNVNVAGSNQTVAASGNPAGVLLGGGSNTNNVAAASINAGTVNYNVWSVPVTVSTRSVYLDALTLKYIGSAPASSFQNLTLYVDGSKVGTATINSNDFAVFDLSSSPFSLTTGGHTIEVHADVVGGAGYTGSFTLQNQADIMLADSQLQGVYVAAITNQSNSTFSQNAAGTISISAGSITVAQDPSFTPTQLTGGSTNVAIAQFVLTDYSEGVKISQITVTPAITSAFVAGVATTTLSLNNVGLYVNGAQVGSLQNWTGGTMTFNLGSSLTVQSGQSVTLTVKADTITSTYQNYTGGSLTVTLGGTTNNAQGLVSNVLSTVPSTTVISNALSLGTGTITLAKNVAYSNQSILANTPNQKIGSFVLQAGSSENTQLTSIAVGFASSSTLPLTSLSNLRTSENTTPVSVASTNTFSVNDIIPANTAREIDIFADVGQIPSSPTLTKGSGTVTVSGTFNAGAGSNPISITVNGQVFTYTVTATTTNYAFVASQLASAITGSSTSPVSVSINNQSTSTVLTLTSLVGGSSSNYTLTTSVGATGGTLTASGAALTGGSSTTATSATVVTTLSAIAQGQTSHSTLTITGNNAVGQTITVTSGALGVSSAIVNTSPVAQFVVGGSTFPVVIYNATSSVGNSTITEMDFTTTNSTISSVTVGGVTAPVVSGTAIVTGLAINVPSGFAGANIPVSVTYNTVGQNGLSTDGLSSTLTLTLVKSQNGNNAIATLSPLSISSNAMTLVASKPTVVVANPGSSVTLGGSTELIDITVSADPAGDINLDSLPISVTTNGGSLQIPAQILVIKDANNNVISTATTSTFTVGTGATATTSVSFLNGVTTGYRIPAGTSQTFKVFANPTGYSGTAGTLSIGTQLGSASFLKWTDINGGSAESALTGASLANYPTDVHTASN